MKLTDFATLEEARAHIETGERMISPDMMVAFLATFGLGRAINTEDTEAAFALRQALQFGSEFNLIEGHPSSVEPLLEGIECATDAFKVHIKAYANQETNPFKDISLIQFNQAKGLCTEKEVKNYNGQDIKITFSSEHDCSATTWVKSDFADENFGKVGHIKKGVNLTKISTTGKKASGKLWVRIPLENADFTVELI